MDYFFLELLWKFFLEFFWDVFSFENSFWKSFWNSRGNYLGNSSGFEYFCRWGLWVCRRKFDLMTGGGGGDKNRSLEARGLRTLALKNVEGT